MQQLLSVFSNLTDSMEQMEEKTKTTNADRCKHYTEKKAEEYEKNDPLRKKTSKIVVKIE